MYDTIIIGSGPAGLTAAIYTTRANLKTLVIAGSAWGGQLMLTTLVENYPGFPEGIMGPELMQKFRDQAARFKAEILDVAFEKGVFLDQPFTVTAGGKDYQGKAVIITSGADTKWLGLPNEQRLIGHGVSSCAPCDAFFFKDKRVIVVGGGDSAMEEALVLTKFASNVIIVHRRDQFRASQIMQTRVKEHPKISIIWNTGIKDVLGEKNVTGACLSSKFKVQSSKLQFKVKNKDTEVSVEELESGAIPDIRGRVIEKKADEVVWEMPIDGLFVAIGHLPNSQVFSGIDIDEKGYIKRYTKPGPGVWQYNMMTNVAGVFVAGDIHDYQYKQAVTAAGFGCMAAMEVEKWLEHPVES
ncbi:FAD-dependent oxidoreductase [Candidatus Woesebacteria bacterium]|nr:FAD-dependent oxidoreductase [Candidatus Woesebacteria bacterium]